MKLHRGAADVLAERAANRGAPVTVTFQVTDRCNYACVHCYQEHVDDDELSTAEVSSILEQLAEAGVLFLTLMGGEFFMRRDADEILTRAHELGFAIKLMTTGHHIHERRAERLAVLRPIQVDMSMYGGTPGVHEAVTRHPGSWQRTLDAARRLIERKIPVLLKAPVMEHNVTDLENLAELADKIGAKYSFDAKITAMENSDQTPVGLRMSGETLGRFYRTSRMTEYLETTYADYDATKELRPLAHTPCRAGQQTVSINPRGQVWPCNALPLPVGDLRKQSFAEIWFDSDALEDVRFLRWAKISECNRCELRNYCQRCHGMALVEHGDVSGPSLEACRHAVAVRDALRERGVVPETETAMPPTWSRIDTDGQHHRRGVRPRGLRVLPE